jgi:toxin ParE1/3/4
MTQVVFDPEAKAEFLEAVRFYEKNQPGLGKRFRLVVESAIQKISECPLLFRIIHSPFRRYLLPKFPYSIVFSIEPDHIRILALAHNKRKPGYWSERVLDRI